MLNGELRPSTLEGVKSLAAQIKKQQGIQHASALDLAARAARCENFTHAIRVLPSTQQPKQVNRVFLTVYWTDDSYRGGRETLQIELSKPVLDICPKGDLHRVRGFGSMRMVAEDHFVCDMLAGSRDNAQERICKAVRSLRFMEHTGLRPAKSNRGRYPDRTQSSGLPGTDHATDWLDPETGQFVLIDEPYRRATESVERANWAQTHNWHLQKSNWPGMYYPYSCEMHVATRVTKHFDFAALMEKIEAIPAPLIQTEWSGDSALNHEVFVSPAARTLQDRRRARSKGTIMPIASNTTLPYATMFGGKRRRPAGSMTIAEHVEVGQLIKSLLASSSRPWSVYTRMDSLRSTLEDWMAREIREGELDGPEFFDVYYHELEDGNPYTERASTAVGMVTIIGLIEDKLRNAYPDCAPLRHALNKLAISRRHVQRMTTSEAHS